MKLIHTSDLHIGKKLHETDLSEYQETVLREIRDIAVKEDADGIIIAGDIFDRQNPSNEAVKIYDDFMTSLWKEVKRPVYMVSGNHDSVDRVSQNGRILDSTGIHISPNFIKHGIRKVTEEDGYGRLNIFLFPYLSPAIVKDRFRLEKTPSWDSALETVIRDLEDSGELDWNERNIAVMHQFITGSERADSENDIGGIDAVSGSILEKFDYVALGHLHRPQTVMNGRMVYSGTPLRYSFSEMGDRKSVAVVTIGPKGSEPEIRREFLPQPYDLMKAEGTFEELLEKGRNMSIPKDSYWSITVTDDAMPDGALQLLRAVYGNVLELRCTGTEREMELLFSSDGDEAEGAKSPFETVKEFFNAMNGDRPLTEKGEEILMSLLREASGEEVTE